MEKILDGQVALVTGGSRGIGRAIAEKLASAGAKVCLTSRSEQRSREAAAQISEASSGEVRGVECDSSSAEACAKLVQEIVTESGRIDILVNNAGVTRDNLLIRMKEDEWREVFETNLHGAFFLSKAVMRPMMKQRSGRIINISSVVGVIGNPGQTNYAATKAGLIGFTKSLAKEVGSRSITVNAIAPGYVATAMTDAMTGEVKEKLQAAIPLGRLGRPEDIAEAVLFLASPGAAYVTGAVLHVDGGLGM